MKSAVLRAITALTMILVTACTAASGPVKEFRIVGFYKGPLQDVPLFDYSKLTHVIFCFTHLVGNQIAIENATDEAILQKLVEQKQRFPKLKVLVSFGGWGGCEKCSPVFSDASDRHAFAISVKNFVRKYNVDGLDVDWESPVIGGYKSHAASPDDKNNFTELIRELRAALPPPLELCFDANSFAEGVQQSYDWGAVMPNVDFVNMMTYGLPNDKPRHTGHHTALYSSLFQKESIHSCIIMLDSLHVPRRKVVIGAAFYGFVVEQVDSVNNGLGQVGEGAGSPYYKDIVARLNANRGYKQYWDTVAHAPYLYSNLEKTFITYDDTASCRLKTEYAMEQGLGGIMFWRINGDAEENGLLDAISHTAQKR